MNSSVDRPAGTWFAAIRLATVASLVAAGVAMLVSVAGDVPQAVVVLPVIVIAFVASWIQSGRTVGVAASRRVVATPAASAPLVRRLVRHS